MDCETESNCRNQVSADSKRKADTDQDWRRQLLFPMDANFPKRLFKLENPPRALDFIGDVSVLNRPSLGIVGTRTPSIHSLALIDSLMASLACQNPSREIAVISGGARGVDEAAHFSAVSQGFNTLLIAPSGLDQIYPESWQTKFVVPQRLFHAASEYEGNARMKPWYFEARNRLIASLSDVLLVVEARLRSGTAITARHALTLSGTLAVVPWHPTDHRGELNHRLIRDGAHPVHDGLDLAMLLEQQFNRRQI